MGVSPVRPHLRTILNLGAMVSQQEKPTYVRRMFDAIAPTYDLMNTVMTAGAHHLWRRSVARQIVGDDPRVVLDLACGTGDLSLAVLQEAMAPCMILGADFLSSDAQPRAREACAPAGATLPRWSSCKQMFSPCRCRTPVLTL